MTWLSHFANGLYRFYLCAPVLPDALPEIREHRNYPPRGYLKVKVIFIAVPHSYRYFVTSKDSFAAGQNISESYARDKPTRNILV